MSHPFGFRYNIPIAFCYDVIRSIASISADSFVCSNFQWIPISFDRFIFHFIRLLFHWFTFFTCSLCVQWKIKNYFIQNKNTVNLNLVEYLIMKNNICTKQPSLLDSSLSLFSCLDLWLFLFIAKIMHSRWFDAAHDF